MKANIKKIVCEFSSGRHSQWFPESCHSKSLFPSYPACLYLSARCSAEYVRKFRRQCQLLNLESKNLTDRKLDWLVNTKGDTSVRVLGKRVPGHHVYRLPHCLHKKENLIQIKKNIVNELQQEFLICTELLQFS